MSGHRKHHQNGLNSTLISKNAERHVSDLNWVVDWPRHSWMAFHTRRFVALYFCKLPSRHSLVASSFSKIAKGRVGSLSFNGHVEGCIHSQRFGSW
jgi:hypothetical protein